MEKHKCKLCFRSFSNGRALGGHMRSHMMNLPIQPSPLEEEEEEEEEQIQLSEETELSSSDDEDDGDGEDEEEKSEFYGLRENPKRSIRLVDPEFSIVVQDRESESESSKNTTRRRSKRTRKSVMLRYQYPRQQTEEQEHIHNNNSDNIKKVKPPDQTESWGVEQDEQVSSISDTTTEEAVAFCLMMMSRDRKWKTNGKQFPDDDVDLDVEVEGEETDESEEFKIGSKNRGKYRCETCKKLFKSYQALGGHRASHKKMKSNMFSVHKNEPDIRENVAGTGMGTGTSTTGVVVSDKKIHECPVCFRIFPSGQALGGHKRSHGTQLIEASRTSIKFNESLIDLNLPAPMEDDEFSQFEFSAVSDAEFDNHFR